MLKEFREFATRGNLVDLAVGVIIGAAFTTVVNSFVNDIIMPPVGLLTGGTDFDNLFITLTGANYETLAAAQEAGAATINYGLFINALINFLIVALVMFWVVRGVNRLEKARNKDEGEKTVEPTEKDCPYCKSAIPIEATRCKFCTSELEA